MYSKNNKKASERFLVWALGVLGIRAGEAGWKAQMNPLSYGGTPNIRLFL